MVYYSNDTDGKDKNLPGNLIPILENFRISCLAVCGGPYLIWSEALSSYCLYSKFGVVMDMSDLRPSHGIHEILF